MAHETNGRNQHPENRHFVCLFPDLCRVGLLKVRPATEVATHTYVNPFIAVFIGTILGKEHVTWIQITGLIIILCSVVLINKKKAVQQKKE